ncbi:AraC family transcriptional regulator [Legionella israelensis]|uniref:AraC family transcriptional regulator n=1 Tax=Legionella israelensis TaxID=454 RepID=UPI00117E7A8B|nr:AraC family transcriptional regulator [Legionella israelensis]QDP72480.1 AraC family transcriptional regulator [Legionella israelensis]
MSYLTQNKFIEAVRYIYDHIDQPFTLKDVAEHIHLSLSTLKRVFAEATGQTPGEFIRKLRMELAFCSLKSKNNSVLEVALSSGFDSQSSFSRCFKQIFGYMPKVARKKLNIISELNCVTLDEPDIVDLKAIHLQCVTEQGLYFESAPKAWKRLEQKLLANKANNVCSGLFIGIGHDNPHEGKVPVDKVRFTAGITLVSNNLGLNEYIIQQGKYARFRYYGKANNLGLAYHYIYGQWSEQPGNKIDRNRPAFNLFDHLPDAIKDHHILIHVPC